MRSRTSHFANNLARFFFVLLCLICAFLVYWMNSGMAALHAQNRVPHLPFGVFAPADGTVFTQDFAYNLLFLQGVRHRYVPHPYRLEDQEQLMRHMIPEATGGMTHAYSPVAFVLALPLVSVSGSHAYLLYTVACSVGIILLFYGYLLQLVERPMQIYAFLVCIVSVCVIAGMNVGQSALITTTLLGALWCLLKKRPLASSLLSDIAIAALWWAICLKPSVAIVPFVLLVGERAWRPLALGLLLLLATWLCVAPYYGGWAAGLSDYLYLLNHYNNADFTPYMQRGYETAAQKQQTLFWFSLDRGLILIAGVALIALRWVRVITASQLFQGAVWAFLLLSPYLLPSENWVICLLIVEGSFFQSRNPFAITGKLLLLAAIMDLRSGVTFPIVVDVYLKWVLFAWIVAEGLLSTKTAAQPRKTQEQPHPVASA